MVDRNDQDYPFIKETIKKRPVNKKALIQKILMAALCGIVFGIFAALTIAAAMPSMLEIFDKETSEQETVRLFPPTSRQTEASPDTETTEENGETKAAEEAGGASDQEKLNSVIEENDDTGSAAGAQDTAAEKEKADDLSDHLSNIYGEIKKIAEEPQKALVRVSGIGENQDLLDHSSLTYGDEEGVVFLKNQDAFYILTVSENLGDSENYRVVFCTGDSAEGTLCGEDPRTGFMVIQVPAENVDEETGENVPAVSLAAAVDQEQADPVIAIGSPTGDSETLVYGNITSVQGRYQISDEEYTVLTTDMVGSSSGNGILLDMEGQMAGVIITEEEEDGNVIRAVSAAQLRPLLETLSNGESIRYLGVLGESVTEEQSQELEIPQGVYVDGVEENSPAMAEGIQCGDILYEIDGREITTMAEYSAVLQSLPVWQKTTVSLYRRNPSGEYVKVELKVMVEEK